MKLTKGQKEAFLIGLVASISALIVMRILSGQTIFSEAEAYGIEGECLCNSSFAEATPIF